MVHCSTLGVALHVYTVSCMNYVMNNSYMFAHDGTITTIANVYRQSTIIISMVCFRESVTIIITYHIVEINNACM